MPKLKTKKPVSQEFISWVILLFLSVIWGLSFLFIKKIVVVFTPIEVGAARVFLAGVFLLPWAYRGLKDIPGKNLTWVGLSGLLGNFIPAFVYAKVGSELNSSLAGTLNSTTPIFVMIIGALFFSAAMKKFQVLGILLGFAGSLLLVLSGNDGKLNFANPYALLAMLGTMMYGFNVNIISKFLKNTKPLYLTSVAFLIVGLMAFMVLPFTDFFSKVVDPANRKLLVYLFCLAGINTSLALVVFNYLLQKTTPVFASSVTYLIPIVAVIAGLFDGELVSVWHYAGMGVTLIGVYLINRK